MARSLMILKSRIPVLEDHVEGDLGSHLGAGLKDVREDGSRAIHL
jgi:hypothetical protein